MKNIAVKIEKNNIIAFDSGYNRSKTAVMDANVTTLISAIILFWLLNAWLFGPSISPKTKAAIEKPTTKTRNLPILFLSVLIIAIK